MDVQLRRLRDEDDYGVWVRVFERALHEDFKDEARKAFRHIVPLDRAYAAEVDGTIVGTASDFPLTYRLHGGAELPIAAVTGVSVAATHRRRGILRQMMDRQLHDAHERGEALAALGASESSIYGRFGYGEVERYDDVVIERAFATLTFDDPREGSFRFVSKEDAPAVLPGVFAAVTADRPGEYTRTDTYWAAHLADPSAWHEGSGEAQHVVYDGPDGEQGYATYRVKNDWVDGGLPANALKVEEVFASSPGALRQLLRWLFEIDLVRTIRMYESTADRLTPWILQEPRRATSPSTHDHTWLRIVDLPRVLGAREYLTDGTWTFAVTDAVLEHNRGTWRLEVVDGEGVVERVDGEGDAVIDIADLASLLMGHVRMTTLVAAARASAAVDVAAMVDRMFSVARPGYAFTSF